MKKSISSRVEKIQLENKRDKNIIARFNWGTFGVEPVIGPSSSQSMTPSFSIRN